jgi:fatty acid desaturase
VTDLAYASTELLYQLGPIAALLFGVGLAVGLLITTKRVLTGRFRRGRDLAVTVRCGLAAATCGVLLGIAIVGPGHLQLLAAVSLSAQLLLLVLLASTVLWPAPTAREPACAASTPPAAK